MESPKNEITKLLEENKKLKQLPKPITWIEIPGQINSEQYGDIYQNLDRLLSKDYYVITVPNKKIDTPQMKLYSVMDIDEETVQSINEKVKNLVTDYKQ